MARARNIKPGFYKNEDLAECSPWARLLFPGLWMLADREGRLEDRPKRIKGEVFPFDSVEVGPLLAELEQWKFIIRYQVDGKFYIQITAFSRHQRPHSREKDSEIPPPEAYQPPALEDHDETQGDAKAQPRHDLGTAKDAPNTDPGTDEPALIPDTGYLIPDPLIPDTPLPARAVPDLPREGDAGPPGGPCGPARAGPETKTNPPPVTAAGAACKAMMAKGLQDANPSHPKLAALLQAGVTPEELADAAKDAVGKGKGFAYALATAEGRRRDVAAMADLPAAAPVDPDSRTAIEAEGVENGLGAWDELREHWPAYKARVRGAAPQGFAPSIVGMVAGALRREAA